MFRKAISFVFVALFVLSLSGSAAAQGTKAPSPEDAAAATDFVVQWFTDVSSANAVVDGKPSTFGRAWGASSTEVQAMIAYFPAEGRVIQFNDTDAYRNGAIGVQATFTGLWESTFVLSTGEFIVSERPDGTLEMTAYKPLELVLPNAATSTTIDVTINDTISVAPASTGSNQIVVLNLTNSGSKDARVGLYKLNGTPEELMAAISAQRADTWPTVDRVINPAASTMIALIDLTPGTYVVAGGVGYPLLGAYSTFTVM